MDLQNLIVKDPLWDETVSGRLYKCLKYKASEEGVEFSLEGKGEIVEFFYYNQEKARLVKYLIHATVNEIDGEVRTFAEGWEYKRYSWWKTAIDEEGIPVDFLNVPLVWLAKDANIENWEQFFRPSKIVSSLKKNPQEMEHAKQAVQQKIAEIVNPFLAPDFLIIEERSVLRLSPLTDRAKTSHIEDNEAYLQAEKNIKKAFPFLKIALVNLASK